MRFIKFAVLAALFAVPVCSADAGILGSLLTFNGTEDTLVDQSVDSFIDVNGDGALGLGDVLFGIAQIDQVVPDSGDEIDVVPARVGLAFAAEVTAFDDAGSLGTSSFINASFGAVTTSPNSLSELLGPGFEGVVDDNDIFAAFERDGGDSFLNFTNTPGTSNSLLNFNSDDFDFIFSGGIADDTEDFFAARLEFNNVSNAFLGGVQRGGFSIFQDTFAGAVYLPVDVLSIDGLTTTSHDITIDNGSTITPADGSAATNGFAFENNVDFTLNVVPEPTSALAFVGIFGFILRRKRGA